MPPSSSYPLASSSSENSPMKSGISKSRTGSSSSSMKPNPDRYYGQRGKLYLSCKRVESVLTCLLDLAEFCEHVVCSLFCVPITSEHGRRQGVDTPPLSPGSPMPSTSQAKVPPPLCEFIVRKESRIVLRCRNLTQNLRRHMLYTEHAYR